MSEPGLLSLCDALAAALQAANLTPGASYCWQPDPWAELSDAALASPVAWVVDYADWSDTPDRFDVPIDEHAALVVLMRKVAPGEVLATQVRAMAAFAEAVQRYCRATTVDEASCVKTERLKARDFDALHDKRLFRAEILTTWRRSG